MRTDAPFSQGESLKTGTGDLVGGLAGARREVRRILQGGKENFTIMSRLVPANLREDYAAVYAFCRVSDDLADDRLADEAADAGCVRALGELRRFRAGLGWACAGVVAGAAPEGLPESQRLVLIALADTLRRRGMVSEGFERLLDAFEQDQRVTRYAHWHELLAYCQGSANPVGRIVLALHGYGDAGMTGDEQRTPEERSRLAASDAICTGLQLANFWQDVRRDLLERDRVYLPSQDTGLGSEELRSWLSRGDDPTVRRRFADELRMLVRQTWACFDAGRILPELVDQRTGWATWLYRRAGQAVLVQIEQQGFATLWERVRVPTSTRVGLLARAIGGNVLGRGAPTDA